MCAFIVKLLPILLCHRNNLLRIICNESTWKIPSPVYYEIYVRFVSTIPFTIIYNMSGMLMGNYLNYLNYRNMTCKLCLIASIMLIQKLCSQRTRDVELRSNTCLMCNVQGHGISSWTTNSISISSSPYSHEKSTSLAFVPILLISSLM